MNDAIGNPGSDLDLVASALDTSDTRSDELKPEHRDTVVETVKGSRSEATRRAYEADQRDFRSWCQQHNYRDLPASAQIVAGYLTSLDRPGDDRTQLALSTIDRRMAAIGQLHKSNGYPNPCLEQIVRQARIGIRNNRALQYEQQHRPPVTQKKEIRIADLKQIITTLDLANPRDVRDKAILLLGYNSALRRSELAALFVSDITTHPEGLELNKRRSKTDQQGRGMRVEVAYGKHPETCAVLAYRQWLDISGITSGRVFRRVYPDGRIPDGEPGTPDDRNKPMSGQAIADIIKKHMKKLSYDPRDYAGHSLRRGFVTESLRNKVDERDIARQTGHTTSRGLDPYASDASLMENPPNTSFDL